MKKINVNSIQVYAHHGCLQEEAVIGGEYVVDVSINFDYARAAQTDDLELTIDYVRVKEIVYREMAIRAKLIESVVERIHTALKSELRLTDKVWVRLTKLNAPMGGQVHSVSVEIEG